MKLLNKTSLNVYRLSGSGGYQDANGNWVEGSETIVPIKCSLQPFRNGDSQRDLPEGIRSDEVYVVYTKTPILSADDRTKRKADEIEIQGVRFECFFAENWNWYGLNSDHYKAVFIKKDKL